MWWVVRRSARIELMSFSGALLGSPDALGRLTGVSYSRWWSFPIQACERLLALAQPG